MSEKKQDGGQEGDRYRLEILAAMLEEASKLLRNPTGDGTHNSQGQAEGRRSEGRLDAQPQGSRTCLGVVRLLVCAGD